MAYGYAILDSIYKKLVFDDLKFEIELYKTKLSSFKIKAEFLFFIEQIYRKIFNLACE